MYDKLGIGNRKTISSPAIDANGYLKDKYGANGKENNPTQFPSVSFDLQWEPIPNAKSYAIIFEDFDACEVVGFPFIHWIVANIKTNKITENQSFNDFKKWDKKGSYPNDILWQGHNSSVNRTLVSNNKQNPNLSGILPEGFTSQEDINSLMYFGPYPPNKEHLYSLTVYGLSEEAQNLEYIVDFQNNKKEKLNKPFYAGDLLQAINNKIVGSHTILFKYKKAD